MGLAASVAARIERRAVAVAGQPLASWSEEGFRSGAFFGSANTASGKPITAASALENTAVFAAVRVIAETVGTLPAQVFERLPNGRGRREAPDHPLWTVLHDAPNPELTAVEFWESIFGNGALRGNAYFFKERLPGGIALWPLNPERIQLFRDEGISAPIKYLYTFPSGETRAWTAFEVSHIRGMSPDGFQGYAPYHMGREAIGIAKAAEEHAARFFGNSARPDGVLKAPAGMPKDALKNLRDSWNASHQGVSNANKTALLEEGVEWQAIGTDPKAAQFLESRKFEVVETARLFRVAPHKIQDLERATFSNIEHSSIQFVQDTIVPWVRRTENRVDVDLFRNSNFYMRFNVAGILRGDTATRFASYGVGLNNGVYTPNEMRAREDLPRIEQAGADEIYIPLNLVPVSRAMDTEEGSEGDE